MCLCHNVVVLGRTERMVDLHSPTALRHLQITGFLQQIEIKLFMYFIQTSYIKKGKQSNTVFSLYAGQASQVGQICKK